MNISVYILEYLKQFGAVKVPQFGVFSLESSKAVINPDNGSILPPSTQIAFHLDYQISSPEFIQFVANHRSVSYLLIEKELQELTEFWKNKLQLEDTLSIPDVGTIFFQEKNMLFQGERVEVDFPDYYGLEEIKLEEISDSDDGPINTKNTKEDYKFNKSILWIFFIILPLGALGYFGYTQQDLILGKKSFDTISVQTKTQRIEPIKPIVIDSALIKKADSLKMDSIRIDSLRQDSINKKATQNLKPQQNYKPKSKWHK